MVVTLAFYEVCVISPPMMAASQQPLIGRSALLAHLPTIMMSDPTAPPPRMCSIYTRETLSFLTRSKVESARQVSSHFNTTYNRCPEEAWPRYNRLARLEFGTVSLTERCGAV